MINEKLLRKREKLVIESEMRSEKDMELAFNSLIIDFYYISFEYSFSLEMLD